MVRGGWKQPGVDRPALAAQQWDALGGPVIGSAAIMTITTELTLSDQQFYRLRLLP